MFKKGVFGVFVVIIFIVLFLSFSLAVLKADSAVLNVSLFLPVNIYVAEKGVLSSLDVDFVLIPINDYRQRVIFKEYSHEPSSSYEDHVRFTFFKDEDFVLISNFVVETSSESFYVTRKIAFPLRNVDSSLLKYVSSSEVYDVNEDIRNLATSIVGDEDDLFKAVFYLAEWVNKNIEYDLSVTSSNQLPASWVLQNRKGVCTEYTSLFIALSRSLGIPAREIQGISFTESDLFPRGWEFHSWAEVFFPGQSWIPFDPTYGQYGFVDASHINLGIGFEDSRKANSFSWLGRDVQVIPEKTDLSVSVIRKDVKDVFSYLSAELFVLEEFVNIGSYNVVWVVLENLNDFYVSEKVFFSGVDGLNFLSPLQRSVVLAPYETKMIYYVVKVNEALSKDFVYTFPLKVYIGDEVYSSEFRVKEHEVLMSKNDVSVFLDEPAVIEGFNCDIKSSFFIEEKVEITCDSLKTVGTICFEDFCEEFEQFESPSFFVSFSQSGLFTKPVLFRSLDGDKKISFLSMLVLDFASLELSKINYTRKMGFSDKGVISVFLNRTSSSVPLNVSFSIKHKFFEETFFIDALENNFLVDLNFYGKDLNRNENVFLLEASFYDILGNSYVTEQEILIYLEGLSFFEGVKLFFRNLFYRL